jgi:hypothetical protein
MDLVLKIIFFLAAVTSSVFVLAGLIYLFSGMDVESAQAKKTGKFCMSTFILAAILWSLWVVLGLISYAAAEHKFSIYALLITLPIALFILVGSFFIVAKAQTKEDDRYQQEPIMVFGVLVIFLLAGFGYSLYFLFSSNLIQRLRDMIHQVG